MSTGTGGCEEIWCEEIWREEKGEGDLGLTEGSEHWASEKKQEVGDSDFSTHSRSWLLPFEENHYNNC